MNRVRIRGSLFRAVREAFAQFRNNGLRTTLTLLGIVFGVASVVAMVSLGEGAQREILSTIEAMGADLVHIKHKPASDKNVAELVSNSSGLSRTDVTDLMQLLPMVSAATYRRRMDIGSADLPVPAQQLTVLAVGRNYFDLHRLAVSQGRRLTPLDHRERHRVVVLGNEIAARAFPNGALGKMIRLEYAYFEVVGVLGAAGKLPKGSKLPLDPAVHSRAILLPFDVAGEELLPEPGYGELELVSMRVNDTAATLRAKQLIEPALLKLHGKVEDTTAVAPEEILRQRQAAQTILNAVLICIAAISLIVGGIGVMNIMLANIMERIPEIGLRRAVGARRRDIRRQFLLEAISICLLGGIVGVITGLIISYVVSAVTDLPVAFAWYSVALSFGISALVGVTFGAMPAIRAANVNPIEALQKG